MEPEPRPAMPAVMRQCRDCCERLRQAIPREMPHRQAELQPWPQEPQERNFEHGSLMVTPARWRNIQILSVETIPQPVEHIARERLLQVELDNLAISHHAKLPGIGICERLDISPA